MIIANQRIRLGIDTSQMGNINDVITGATPQFWNGVDLQFELAIFYGALLADISNFDSITIDLKEADPRTGLPLMSATIGSGQLHETLTLQAWQGGAATDCHALIAFTNEQTNLDLKDDAVTYWLVISAITADSPAHKIVLGATPLNVVEGGEGVEPPASVVEPTYYTAAQSDARYSRTVDLTTINNQLSTLNGEMTAVTTTANAALPQAGGTVSGSLTVAGLSGVLKATSGLISGGATTGNLPEGSNLYFTNARAAAYTATVAGAAGGLCPLDSNALVPAQYLPSITVHDTFVVSSQSAMLALAAHQGDVAIRTDLNETFILVSGSAATLGNWAQLLSPTSPVASVNGLTGTVVLTTTNLGEGSNKYYTTARGQADALTAELTGFSSTSGGTVAASDTMLSALGKLENRVALDDAKADGATRVLKAGDTMTGALLFSGSTNPGVVLSSLTSAQRGALSPVNGMIVYDSTLAQVMCYLGSWSPLSLGGEGTTWFAQSGAPDSSLGQAGNWCLDTSTGNIYLNNLISGVPTWQLIFAPSVSGFVPLGGGTMSGVLQFSGNGNPGVRLNNLTTVQQNALTAGAGATIFNTSLGVPSFYNGSGWFALNTAYNTSTGKLQYFNGSAWANITFSGLGGSSVSAPVTVTGGSYTMLATDSLVLCKGLTAAPGMEIQLPVSPVAGQVYWIKSINSSYGTGIWASNGNIDGTAYNSTSFSYVLNYLQAAAFVHDGTNWWNVARN